MFKDCQTNLPGATSPGQTCVMMRKKGSQTVYASGLDASLSSLMTTYKKKEKKLFPAKRVLYF